MTNTDKLLHALIDAMGFEVEEVRGPSIDPKDVGRLRKEGFPVDSAYDLTGTINGRYHAKDPIIDYKLTKKRGWAIKCTKCEQHIGDGLPLDACRCKSSANLVRVRY